MLPCAAAFSSSDLPRDLAAVVLKLLVQLLKSVSYDALVLTSAPQFLHSSEQLEKDGVSKGTDYFKKGNALVF